MPDELLRHFLHCDHCDLIWCDNMGDGETECPRCYYAKQVSELEYKVDSLRDEVNDVSDRAERAEERAQELESMIDDMNTSYERAQRRWK